MNRMWVRLSLAFAAVILIATVIPYFGFFILETSGLVQTTSPSFFDMPVSEELPLPPDEIVADVIIEEIEFVGFGYEIPLGWGILMNITSSLLIGSILGIWISRGITKPVTQLVEATEAIKERDLAYRVETQGSQELVHLAQSFNHMADDLERTESLRQNLMADVAHELRTPLTVLEGNLRAILDDVYTLSKEEVALLYDQTRHLNRLVEDLRELALAEANQLSLNLQSTDVKELIEDTLSHFSVTAKEKNIQISTELDRDLPLLELDAHRIRQVLYNLLSNALEHTPENGNIIVEANQSKNEIQVAIFDDGAGIAPEEVPHIFDRFYRTDATRSRDTGGTGLGLVITKTIVEAHSGRIQVESEGIDQGSTFTVCLPFD